MTSRFFSRTTFVSLGILLLAIIFVAKLFLVQIVHSSSYSERADRQYVTPIGDIFERGTIFFQSKDGNLVSAAVQTAGFKVAINPTEITDQESVYSKISAVVTVPREEFFEKASKTKDPYEEVANHISKDQADAISKEKIKGVYVYKEKWRFYPGEDLASHALGLLGYKGDKLGGRYGLERQYNDVLSQNEDNSYVNFFAEVFSNIDKTIFKDETRSGDVVTTIEPVVQGFLEKSLEGVNEKYSTDSIGGIIMNPKDGSIYALSVKPDFDPNDFSKIKTVSVFSNPLVENVLEFGSVVKPLVMAAGLDTKVVNAKTAYEDKGQVKVEKYTIYNFDKKARGPGTTMQDVLNQSLNTGMVYVQEKLGRVPLRNYLLSYGIDKKTGIDLPNETSGLVSNIMNSPRQIEYANAAFGQGIALTPIAMIRALASLANGGNLVTPHVVDRIKYDNGTEDKIKYETTRTKISEQTSEEITRMMVTVMDKGLKAGLPNFSVAVKTGTAQVADKTSGGYYEDRHTHSIVGYFPAFDPKFIVFLYAVNPKGVEYSATTWTKPLMDITKFLLNYYEVPPDR